TFQREIRRIMGVPNDLGTGSNLLNEQRVAITASAITAVLLVSGFCWVLVYLCRPNKRHAPRAEHPIRKVRAHSITSGASVPGDSHGHYYAPRDSNIYMDRDMLSMGEIQNSLRIHAAFPSIFDQTSKTLPVITTDDSYLYDGEPPSYPGQLNEVLSHSHGPSKARLPPPYSA
ncbi:unnamed protein product, partial [Allacma fusca]